MTTLPGMKLKDIFMDKGSKSKAEKNHKKKTKPKKKGFIDKFDKYR